MLVSNCFSRNVSVHSKTDGSSAATSFGINLLMLYKGPDKFFCLTWSEIKNYVNLYIRVQMPSCLIAHAHPT